VDSTPKVCKEPGCEKTLTKGRGARGMCQTHYTLWWRANGATKKVKTCIQCEKTFTTRSKRKQCCSTSCASIIGAKARSEAAEHRRKTNQKLENKICGTPGCDTKIRRDRKFCDPCRLQIDNPLGGKPKTELRIALDSGNPEHFFKELQNNVQVDEYGCWNWKGPTKQGYARISTDQGFEGLHRVVLEVKHGKKLGSQAGHHMCANPTCVNPEHLQPVTHRENTAEMLARHSYIKRIKELEQALTEIDQNHPLLALIPVE
jgi:hypothetical protein